MRNLAPKVLSVLFHPLLMPSIGLLIILQFGVPQAATIPFDTKNFLFMVVFIATFLLPLTLIILLRLQNFIKSYKMQAPQERIVPLFLTFLAMFFTFFLLGRMIHNAPYLIKLYVYFIRMFLLAACIVVVVSIIISLFWRISLHMVGIGGVIGMVIALSLRLGIDLQIVLMTLFIIAGLAGYSRLKLDAHSPAQVYTGFGLGAISLLGILLMV